MKLSANIRHDPTNIRHDVNMQRKRSVTDIIMPPCLFPIARLWHCVCSITLKHLRFLHEILYKYIRGCAEKRSSNFSSSFYVIMPLYIFYIVIFFVCSMI